MGMGEPLLNLDELRKALAFITDKDGLNFSKRRITLSTSGIISGINSLAVEGPDIRLALSLISANEKLREKLIPAARENPLPLIKESLLKYQEKTGHRITLEIVLLGSINSSHSEAEAVKKFSRGLQTIINIIPWNPVPGLLLEGHPIIPPTTMEINDFMSALSLMGLNVTLRTGKGLGVSGACGQLGHS
jgi:23S rRNA (adenine2503-C2)-methyltransferase